MGPWEPARIAHALRKVPVKPEAELQDRRAAVALVLRPGTGGAGPDLLLMRRAEHPQDPWSGQVSLPGGRHEEHDPDLVATAMRETREEVSVDLDAHASLLGSLQPLRARARGRVVPMDVAPFVFGLDAPVQPIAGEEASEVFWLPLEPVLRGELDAPFEYRQGEIHRELPSWRYEGRVVWGMTHRIVGDLLGILHPRDDGPV